MRFLYLLFALTHVFADVKIATPCSQDCDSDAKESEESQKEREFERMHTEPLDTLVVSIFNMNSKWHFQRLNQIREGWSGFDVAGGKPSPGQLWKLEDHSEEPGWDWFITNVGFDVPGDHLNIASNLNVGTNNGDWTSYDNWKFKEVVEGGYLLINTETGAVPCLHGEQSEPNIRGFKLYEEGTDENYVCLLGEDGHGAGGTTLTMSFDDCKAHFLGSGKSFSHYPGDNRCLEIANTAPAFDQSTTWKTCFNVGADTENKSWGMGCLWRFENMWKSDAMWHTVTTINNEYDTSDMYKIVYKVGYSSTISQSKSHNTASTTSMSISGSGSIKGIGLGADITNTLTQEFSQTVSMSYSEEKTMEKTHQIEVLPHSCITVKQLVVNQKDKLEISLDENGAVLPDFQGSTETLWIKSCGDTSDNGTPTKPNDGTSRSDALSEGVYFAEPEDLTSNTPVAVYALAAVGFGVVTYGATKYYTSPTKDEDMIPLEP